MILQVGSALDAPDGLLHDLDPASDYIHFVPGTRGLRLDFAQQETAQDADVLVVVLSKGHRDRSDGRCGRIDGGDGGKARSGGNGVGISE